MVQRRSGVLGRALPPSLICCPVVAPEPSEQDTVKSAPWRWSLGLSARIRANRQARTVEGLDDEGDPLGLVSLVWLKSLDVIGGWRVMQWGRAIHLSAQLGAAEDPYKSKLPKRLNYSLYPLRFQKNDRFLRGWSQIENTMGRAGVWKSTGKSTCYASLTQKNCKNQIQPCMLYPSTPTARNGYRDRGTSQRLKGQLPGVCIFTNKVEGKA